jgi:hypothetical protein
MRFLNRPPRKLVLALLLGVLVPAAVSQTLSVHPSNRYLVTSEGKPFFMSGDAGWSLIAQISKADADQYLENRRQLGFNVVMANLIEHAFASNAPRNYYGDAPFTGKAFVTPNEAYFAHADYVISSAAQKGITLLLAPVYLGYQCGYQGWCQEIQDATSSEMRQWGQYVGNRYKNYDNIIWLIGGDTSPTPVKSKLEEFVAGILDNDTRHLFSAHNQPGSMAVDPYRSSAWLNVNNIYYRSVDAGMISAAQGAYNYSPTMPFFMLEAVYENEGASTQQLRAESYWPVLSGGMGYIFGNCPIWHFGSNSGWCGTNNWKGALNSGGATSMNYCQRLFNSREWWDLAPDFSHSILTSGYSSVATSASSASIIAYMPSSRQVSVNTTGLAGDSIKAWWYNPSNGAATLVGTYGKGSQNFTPPSSGDWVLVVDSKDKNFPAPGNVPTSVERDEGSIPESLELRQNYPNPFNGTTSIRYALPSEMHVTVDIYNALGERIRRLVDATQEAGQYAASWDGRDSAGATLGSGVYVAVMKAGEHTAAQKMLLLK